MNPKLSLRDRIKLIKRVLVNKESISSVCKDAKISRTLFYRWLQRYKKNKKPSSLLPKLGIGARNKEKIPEELSPKERLLIIEKVRNGEQVGKVCLEFGISRTIFYKWLNRYNQAEEGQKLEALWDRKPEISRYFNQSPEEYEEAVLSAVTKYPELSCHKLVKVLPYIGNKPILSSHGVYNILKRNDLTEYNQRLLYALEHSKTPYVGKLIKFYQRAISSVLGQSPAVRSTVVRSSLTIALGLFIGVTFWGAVSFLKFLGQSPTMGASIGTLFALTSLFFGFIFFIYSLKYYFSIGIVLSFSRKIDQEEERGSSGSLWQKIFGITIEGKAEKAKKPLGSGLYPDISDVKLEREPFISIHIGLYNEKRVAERLMTALTSFKYENYEVIIVDDSTDETIQILDKWKDHPRVKIIHRESRAGFKGGALNEALKATDPKTEFVVVFDADFIPYPDSLVQFLKYFKVSSGSLGKEEIRKTKIGAVQGYQWHVLNKSENWITRGVRTEYAGSYVLERSAMEIYGGLKQIAGSVYMIRADLLKELGWGVSITEDFELTLRLYEKGYKVVYTPYIQAAAEAVSTIKRMIRQRMRWSEGHSQNVKKMFLRLLFSKNLSFAEKLEVIYVSPYYLQAFFFMIGTFSWFAAEAVFKVRIPFWTELWGWSLILTNMFSLPLMNLVGLFLEEADEKDYLGLFSFMALSYIVAPFQGYASVKGFIEKQEGPWFRTPKTGRITDTFTPGHFYRYIRGIFGKTEAAEVSPVRPVLDHAYSQYLALATANNRFDNFEIKKVKRLSRVSRATLAVLLIFSTTSLYLSKDVKLAYATTYTGPLKLSVTDTGDSIPAGGNFLKNNEAGAAGGTLFVLNSGAGGKNNFLWYSNLWPSGADNAFIPGGNYYVNLVKSGNSPVANRANGILNVRMQLFLTSTDGATKAILATNHWMIRWNNADNSVRQYSIGNLVNNTIVSTAQNRLMLLIGIGVCPNCTGNIAYINFVINNSANLAQLVTPGNITVPEIPKPVMMVILLVILPAMPALVSGRFRKKGQNIFEEFRFAWFDFIKKLIGLGEIELDELPV